MSDDELANDRTFLAWLRTSLALIAITASAVAGSLLLSVLIAVST